MQALPYAVDMATINEEELGLALPEEAIPRALRHPVQAAVSAIIARQAQTMVS